MQHVTTSVWIPSHKGWDETCEVDDISSCSKDEFPALNLYKEDVFKTHLDA